MKISCRQIAGRAIEAEVAWRARATEFPDNEKRKLFRLFFESRRRAIDEGRILTSSRPEYLRGLTCGARTRSGTPCKMTALSANGRCTWHGGKSTGPRTAAGKEKALANLALGRRTRMPNSKYEGMTLARVMSW